MELLYQILGILAFIGLIFILYNKIKSRPDLFTKENLNKSFYTMGILALVLIGFIFLLILMLRAT